MKGFFRPPCLSCGAACATIEIVAPNEFPVQAADWTPEMKQVFQRTRNADDHILIYSGPGGSNGLGDKVDCARAEQIIAAFSAKVTKESISAADFYDNAGFCPSCSEFYCPKHWSISQSGYGTCPRGHGQSLDPHWSPDDDW